MIRELVIRDRHDLLSTVAVKEDETVARKFTFGVESSNEAMNFAKMAKNVISLLLLFYQLVFFILIVIFN